MIKHLDILKRNYDQEGLSLTFSKNYALVGECGVFVVETVTIRSTQLIRKWKGIQAGKTV